MPSMAGAIHAMEGLDLFLRVAGSQDPGIGPESKEELEEILDSVDGMMGMLHAFSRMFADARVRPFRFEPIRNVLKVEIEMGAGHPRLGPAARRCREFGVL